MLADFLIAIRADVCCVVIILFLFFKSFRTLGMTNNARSFRKIMAITIVYISAYSVEECIMTHLIPPNRIINTFLIITILVSQSILCYLWFIYSETLQNTTLVDTQRKRRYLMIPMIVFFIALFISIKTNWIFIIQENGMYARGPYSWTQYIIIVLYLFGATIRSFLKSLNKANYAMRSQLRTLSSFILGPIASTLYQYFSPQTFMTGIGITVSIIVLYMNLQYETVSVDDLTQINNRQTMIRFLSQQITNKSENLYLLMLDANKFKMINDTYGHIEGDKALIRIAQGLRNVAAKHHCFISRYGGDEFLVICEAESEQNVRDLAEDINKEIRKVNEESGAHYSLGVSVGYAKCPDKTISIPEFIQLADQQLYLAKQETKH